VVGADLLREDSGLVTAAIMGMVLANQKRVDVAKILEFHGTIVGLLIGILFVLLSASVTPSQFHAVLGSGLVLVAVMVFVIRPVVVAIGTWRSSLSWRERAFAAWMAPRGIVAAATASAFGLSLTQAGVAGADQVLPIAFVVIFATVVLYGLTATLVAKLLGVAGAGAPVVLIIGGQEWARDMAVALGSAGVRVRLWTGRRDERESALAAGLDAGPPPLGVDVERLEDELEEVSDALVMTESDDFNALAAYELRQALGRDRVYRLASRETAAAAPGATEVRTLFGGKLTYPALSDRIEAGAEIVELPRDGPVAAPTGGWSAPLFIVSADGRLQVATADRRLEPTARDRLICLTNGRT
jgi:hypothetical protein